MFTFCWGKLARNVQSDCSCGISAPLCHPDAHTIYYLRQVHPIKWHSLQCKVGAWWKHFSNLKNPTTSCDSKNNLGLQFRC